MPAGQMFTHTGKRRVFFPPCMAEQQGFEPSFLGPPTEIQLRNPLRNRGKSGVNRGGRVGRLRVKLHHFDPCRPPRKGFESLHSRQLTR